MTIRAILLMAEYAVGDSPLWFRGDDLGAGLADAGALGLSTELRRDLRAWNDVFDAIAGTGFRFPSDEVEDAHRADAFDLAARVQEELGDDTRVWCGAGEGVDAFPEAEGMLLLDATSEGTSVDLTSGRRRLRITAEQAGARSATVSAIRGWREATAATGSPLGTARTRADGLRTAGALQRDVGRAHQVVFVGGASAPGDTVRPPLG